ncbi:MAG TPA: hypothetical protein VJT31_23615 [Rugosimonospora sp.]|nr:hypothetical protein [Rugosimonospora sp.]
MAQPHPLLDSDRAWGRRQRATALDWLAFAGADGVRIDEIRLRYEHACDDHAATQLLDAELRLLAAAVTAHPAAGG